ncbi:hypothetical protein L2E82_50456 [Cichorium intybus]|nr:hypothetical protein L2E82_50456 [Cichorium intybus]
MSLQAYVDDYLMCGLPNHIAAFRWFWNKPTRSVCCFPTSFLLKGQDKDVEKRVMGFSLSEPSLEPAFSSAIFTLPLKALILERMGKSEEALSVCIIAKDLVYKNDLILIDDLTLRILQIEYACGKFPNNLELMMGLFDCYVRQYSFVKQQQIVIKMYKIAGEERFLLWAVCSIHLHVFCGNVGEKLLQLAEGLLKKHIASHSLHEPEVFLQILPDDRKKQLLEKLAKSVDSSSTSSKNGLRIWGNPGVLAGKYTLQKDPTGHRGNIYTTEFLTETGLSD